MVHTNHKRDARRFLRIMGVLTLVAGLFAAVSSATPSAHASRANLHFSNICWACFIPRPTIEAKDTGAGDGSVAVSGWNFTPGWTVHIELIGDPYFDPAVPVPTAQPGQDPSPPPPFIPAAADVTAGLALTLPLGTGQYVTVPGGDFGATLIPNGLGCGQHYLTVTATDEATGETATVNNVSVQNWSC